MSVSTIPCVIVTGEAKLRAVRTLGRLSPNITGVMRWDFFSQVFGFLGVAKSKCVNDVEVFVVYFSCNLYGLAYIIGF
ncbi:MAG: hypothetical protein NTX52_01080 [Planctomycetota bacterium]|nr:hypothetical protein [Planctomycetota bacterium]